MVVVGSGPGGLQTAYSLARAGIPRCAVISRDSASGGMFRRFPVYQRLVMALDTGGAINGRHVDVYRAPPSDPSDGGRSLTGQRVLIVPPGGRIPRGVPSPSGGSGASGTSGSGHTPSGGTSAR